MPWITGTFTFCNDFLKSLITEWRGEWARDLNSEKKQWNANNSMSIKLKQSAVNSCLRNFFSVLFNPTLVSSRTLTLLRIQVHWSVYFLFIPAVSPIESMSHWIIWSRNTIMTQNWYDWLRKEQNKREKSYNVRCWYDNKKERTTRQELNRTLNNANRHVIFYWARLVRCRSQCVVTYILSLFLLFYT